MLNYIYDTFYISNFSRHSMCVEFSSHCENVCTFSKVSKAGKGIVEKKFQYLKKFDRVCILSFLDDPCRYLRMYCSCSPCQKLLEIRNTYLNKYLEFPWRKWYRYPYRKYFGKIYVKIILFDICEAGPYLNCNISYQKNNKFDDVSNTWYKQYSNKNNTFVVKGLPCMIFIYTNI